jgi:hypothetical protein
MGEKSLPFFRLQITSAGDGRRGLFAFLVFLLGQTQIPGKNRQKGFLDIKIWKIPLKIILVFSYLFRAGIRFSPGPPNGDLYQQII